MSPDAFKPVSLEQATAFAPVSADALASLLTPKRGRNKPVPQVEKPRIPSIKARFYGGYLDGVERDIPEYYVTKRFLYRTINTECRPERGMELDRLFGECSSYELVNVSSVPGEVSTFPDGFYQFVLVQEGGASETSELL